MRIIRGTCVVLLAVIASCAAPNPPAPATAPAASAAGADAGLLYVWAGDQDEADADFLAVLDARPDSPRYGSLISTVPVPGRGNWPHHTEYELSPGRELFANAWGTGRTFRFDLTDPRSPRIAGAFAARAGYAYPHSYARLANGHVLATFQSGDGEYGPQGGIVELDEAGTVVRGVSGIAPGLPARESWPYSLLALPDLDRLVTTNTRMGTVEEWKAMGSGDTAHVHADAAVQSTHVQVWRLSDLRLLATIQLPAQDGGHNALTAEPRRLANGDVYVNTFTCGLYRIAGLDTERPTAEPALHGRFEEPGWCAVPVVIGNFWIQPSATEHAIVVYDLADAARPREASRLALDSTFRGPHWLAADPAGSRIVATSDANAWVLIINVDPATGALRIDERFREEGVGRPGVTFDRATWPHGAGGRALPHGAVFGPDRR